MRTQQEILDKIEEVKKNDWLGVMQTDLLAYLSYENAKQFLKEEVTEEEWSGVVRHDKESILKSIVDYFDFAVEKATDHKGISAGRSIQHYEVWTWLLGDYDKINWDNYENYGAPILKQIANLYDLPWPEGESLDRMAKGESCGADYPCGCGG